MARKKTKAQKKQTAQRRRIEPPVASLSQESTKQVDTTTSAQPSFDPVSILGYPIELLYKDLFKSAVITTTVIAFLVGIYLYFRYNGVALV